MEEEKELEEAVKNDKCPACKEYMREFPYIVGMKTIGWFVCPTCGCVFCPESIRNEIMKRGSKKIIEPPTGLKV